jgi:hypothetical protein
MGEGQTDEIAGVQPRVHGLIAAVDQHTIFNAQEVLPLFGDPPRLELFPNSAAGIIRGQYNAVLICGHQVVILVFFLILLGCPQS